MIQKARFEHEVPLFTSKVFLQVRAWKKQAVQKKPMVHTLIPERRKTSTRTLRKLKALKATTAAPMAPKTATVVALQLDSKDANDFDKFSCQCEISKIKKIK